MSNICCIVEGQTEQTFIREVLAPFLGDRGCYLQARLIGSPGHKGGSVTFPRFAHDAEILLRQNYYHYVSTMLDYFRLDAAWPGMDRICQAKNTGRVLTPSTIEAILSKATKEALDCCLADFDVKNRIIPYFSMHEFEALLFSNVSAIESILSLTEHTLDSTLQAFGDDPEKINTNPDKAPSKILLQTYVPYKKILHGCRIAKSIGIPRIREKCSCYDAWITTLLEKP
jgi:hypothetical protein